VAGSELDLAITELGFCSLTSFAASSAALLGWVAGSELAPFITELGFCSLTSFAASSAALLV